MPPEAATAPAPTQAEPKQTAANIAKAVQDKANGKVPASRGPERPPEDGDEKGKAKATADPNAGKQKVVVEGKEYWLTPEQISAYAQKGIAFEPRVSQLDRMQREFAQLEQSMLNDPGRILTNLAARAKVPIQTLVERVLSGTASDEVKEATGKWYWENVAKRMRMDPKDLQILEQDEKIKRLEEADKQKAATAVAMENRQRVVKAMAEVSGQIRDTLTELGVKNVDGPAAIRLTREIADIMRVSYFAKQPCTAKQAAEKVRARIMDYQKQFYDELDMDKLVEVLGKDNADKVRKYFLKLVKEKEEIEQKPSGPGKIQKRDERQTINMDQFHDYLDDLKRKSK